MKPMIGIDLFCGGGGATEGFENGGMKIALAVDSWEAALRVHEANHPETPTLRLSLGGCIKSTARILMRYLPKNRDGFHFHLHGSPPCQAFSTASRHKTAAGYPMLEWFLELVKYMKPDSWSMENVIPSAKFLPEWVPFQKINAADYGVPQIRKRVFAGEGWELIPTHEGKHLSIRDALPDIEGELEEFVNKVIKPRTLDQPSRTITSKTASQSKLTHKGVKIRTLTLEENATLQGWDGMIFPSGILKRDLWVIVGNMVCPPITERMAKLIKEGL